MTTLKLIILLAWFSLSLAFAVFVGKCIKLGMAEPAKRVGVNASKPRRRGAHLARCAKTF